MLFLNETQSRPQDVIGVNKVSLRRMISFSVALMFAVSVVQSQTVIDIPAGETELLIQAISSANDSQDSWKLRLASNSEYLFDLPDDEPDPITGHVIVEGNSARLFGGDKVSFGQLFSVEDGGTLELSNLLMNSFNSGDDFNSPDRAGLIHIKQGGKLIARDLRFEGLKVDLLDGILGAVLTNEGHLTLDRVRFTNVTAGPSRATVVWNSGQAHLRNVLIADSIADKSSTDPGFGGTYVTTVGGTRNLVIEYSTFMAKSDLSESDILIIPIGLEGGIGFQPEATYTGTLFIGVACPSGPISTSLGFNLHTDMRCAGFFDGDHDLVGVSAQPLLVAYDDGLLVIPQKGSKALDGGNHRASHCPELDTIGTRRPQDGKGNGKARCDIGAFEAREQAPLFDGGENGLYYDAGHDGHFVSVQEVRPNEYVISWNAFDLDGNQSWVIAIGAREGDTITADTWFLPEGRLLPGGSADVDTSALQEWGTISIRLLDCQSGAFTYQSSLPQFGSGSFPLDRLAGIFGLGCRAP